MQSAGHNIKWGHFEILHNIKWDHFEILHNTEWDHLEILHNTKWDHLEILEREKTDEHCLIKEGLSIKQLSPDLSKNTVSEKFYLY